MLNILDKTDPGDETLQRYRYQHAYGLLLALGALRKTGAAEYTALYCEHHEDLLGLLSTNDIHVYQVKTRKKELGAWKTTDDAFVHSIQRFVQLDTQYPASVQRFVFVSNTELRSAGPKAKAGEKALSPILLLTACQDCDDPQTLPDGIREGFNQLKTSCECDGATLLSVLKRMEFKLGPDLFNFQAELVSDALPAHPECRQLTVTELKRLARQLIDVFTEASALPVDPDARVLPEADVKRGLTTVKAKRVEVSQIAQLLAHAQHGPQTVVLPDDLAATPLDDSHTVLVQKLTEGDLTHQINTMKRRLLTAYEWAREQQIIDEQLGRARLSQLEGIVEGVYADEHAVISQQSPPWGRQLYSNMLTEFKRLANDEPERVCHQNSDKLFGIAGLLTEKCRVWWSPRFTVQVAP
ncbi:dsDNA nuclease domain-containing protein [Deinococcus knuensis]|uniref:CD-NTase associated protein 4-like DNA endonuclease domain-containing protein n=1 Tax=Deinococcus knuensis TaxID=1837380 RepID=A0ABQ2SUX7_9DEIO|nr:dsDNA nuclease domain-containing protein [Deinococcus knuensis]GGS41252.1 hypothetical protein GCM10008961_35640 [Deinococcus knuensis]